jgi:ZIP family zinc transporter
MTLIIGLLIPLLGTILGAAFVFLMKDEMPLRLQKLLLGFASGVMVAASVANCYAGFSRHYPQPS